MCYLSIPHQDEDFESLKLLCFIYMLTCMWTLFCQDIKQLSACQDLLVTVVWGLKGYVYSQES